MNRDIRNLKVLVCIFIIFTTLGLILLATKPIPEYCKELQGSYARIAYTYVNVWDDYD